MLNNLAAARKAAGVRQIDAAAMIGKTQATYSKIERGDVAMSAADALILCRAFGLDLETLLSA